MGLSSGDKFGRYAIEEPIGQGGMGQVFRARDTVLSRVVALKIMLPALVAREQSIARFHREARLAAQLTHPNTVRIYDLGEIDQTLFIAMEYIAGRPLTAYCNETSVGVPQKLAWMAAVARALAAAHKVELLHRDVKPGNIMVSVDGTPKVVDFGLAKGELPSVEGRPHFQTQLGHIVGTPEFMAPEQLDAEPLDGRADQFAWGLTAHALLRGYGPRRVDPLLRSPIPRLDKTSAQVSARVADVVARSLELDKSRRYETMDALADALDSALATSPSPAVRVIVTVPPVPAAPAANVIVRAPTKRGSGNRAAPFVRAAEPERWHLQRSPSCDAAPLRAAAFSPNGGEIAAIGDRDLLVYRDAKWKAIPRPAWLTHADARCIAIGDDGRVFVGGANGLAACFQKNGQAERWRTHSPGDLDGLDLHGIDVDPPGKVTFVGGDASGRGILATTGSGLLDLQIIPVPSPLLCTARLEDGRRIVAGASGAIATISSAGRSSCCCRPTWAPGSGS